jgi:hypothetical protein
MIAIFMVLSLRSADPRRCGSTMLLAVGNILLPLQILCHDVGRRSSTLSEDKAIVDSAGPAGVVVRRPDVGGEVRRWRQTRAMTLAQVGERSGLNVGYLSQIENG